MWKGDERTGHFTETLFMYTSHVFELLLLEHAFPHDVSTPYYAILRLFQLFQRETFVIQKNTTNLNKIKKQIKAFVKKTHADEAACVPLA